MTKLRDFVAVVVLFAICLLAIYQKMEILAVTAVILIGIVIYRNRVRSLLDIGFDILRRAQSAKIGDVEFTAERKAKATLDASAQHPEWVRMLLSDLTGEQVALLIAIFKEGKLGASDKENLRILRTRGLLLHNQQTMAESTEVWLTPLGQEVAAQLLGTATSTTNTQTPQPT